MKILTFSTGNMYKTMDVGNIDLVMDFLRPLGLEIDGYMLSLTDVERVKNFNISEENLTHMKSMKWNSIHAPVVDYNDDEETRDMLRKLKEIYDMINAKQIIFHPYRIKDFSLLKDSGMNCVIEFMRPAKEIEMHYYGGILKENPWLGFAPDIAHAAEFSIKTITELFEKFKERTTQAHISFAGDGLRHNPMFKATPEFLKAAECIKQLDIEFSIEAVVDKPEDIKKEVKFCRKWLENHNS
ncbi:hypothetical protein ACFL6I_25475 [candidate division KSB1 bacterium]